MLGSAEGTVTVDPISAMVLVQGGTREAPSGKAGMVLLPIAALAAVGAAAFVFLRKKK